MVSSVEQPRPSLAGLVRALRRVGRPLLLVAVPIAWVVASVAVTVDAGLDLGFDFRGTLWEPARAVVHGGPIYADPTSDAVAIGNPSVYPPLAIVLTVPLGLLPFGVATWLWAALLAACVAFGLWLLGCRDPLCFVVALTSPVVLHGLVYGNLSLALVLPLALAWRYRDRGVIAGLAVGLAVAAKLVVLPLVAWLLLTRRFRAAAAALVSAALLIAVPWALIGFEGMSDYPALVHAVNHVYGVVSLSTATLAAGLGAPTSLAIAVSAFVGVLLFACAWWVAGQADGDRRAFAVLVGACVLASPIVWQNYLALLFVPIAVTWPRLAAPWGFGLAVWLAGLLPKPAIRVPEPCCRPQGVDEAIWAHSHAIPAWGQAAGTMAVAAAVTLWLAIRARGDAVAVSRRGPA